MGLHDLVAADVRMAVQDRGESVTLHAADGSGDHTFDALVIRQQPTNRPESDVLFDVLQVRILRSSDSAVGRDPVDIRDELSVPKLYGDTTLIRRRIVRIVSQNSGSTLVELS